jgi:hypothetical protein
MAAYQERRTSAQPTRAQIRRWLNLPPLPEPPTPEPKPKPVATPKAQPVAWSDRRGLWVFREGSEDWDSL